MLAPALMKKAQDTTAFFKELQTYFDSRISTLETSARAQTRFQNAEISVVNMANAIAAIEAIEQAQAEYADGIDQLCDSHLMAAQEAIQAMIGLDEFLNEVYASKAHSEDLQALQAFQAKAQALVSPAPKEPVPFNSWNTTNHEACFNFIRLRCLFLALGGSIFKAKPAEETTPLLDRLQARLASPIEHASVTPTTLNLYQEPGAQSVIPLSFSPSWDKVRVMSGKTLSKEAVGEALQQTPLPQKPCTFSFRQKT